MKILKIILFLICCFSFSLTFGENSFCFAAAKEREVIEIGNNNFFEDFYFNEKLYGESGEGFTVKFVEDIDLDVSGDCYFDYLDGFYSGAFSYFMPSGTFTACIDGNFKKISNLRVDYNENDERKNLFLFEKLQNVKISNLTFENISLISKESAGILCMEAEDCIFDNVCFSSCVLYSKTTFGFAMNAKNCYFISSSLDASSYATLKCFEFAASIEECGFKECEIEVSLEDNGENAFIENLETDNEWTQNDQTGLTLLSSKILFVENISDDEETSNTHAEVQNFNTSAGNVSVSNVKGESSFETAEIIVSGLCVLLVLTKNLIMLLTKKK